MNTLSLSYSASDYQHILIPIVSIRAIIKHKIIKADHSGGIPGPIMEFVFLAAELRWVLCWEVDPS